MAAIRSVLWIGSGETLSGSAVTQSPTLDVTWVRDADEALALHPGRFDAAVVDDCDVRSLRSTMGKLRRRPKFPPMLACIPASEASTTGELLAAGAADVLLSGDRAAKPSLADELQSRLERIQRARLANRRGRAAAVPEPCLPGVVGHSRAMREVAALVVRAAGSCATVLITGETGTGKEVIARAIHELGPRRGRDFVAINCAAFPDTLLESELFGHRRGAFTGADREKKGLFEVADGGTLFLDEIGETSAPLQAKLLRVLQERELRPLGSARTRAIDVRVIAATNRAPREAVEQGALREDLYYRLAVFPIGLPPLRSRCEDIVPLAEHFLALHGLRDDKRECHLSRAAMHLLLAYPWPGNVRELENEMQRVLALAEPGELIAPPLLSDRILSLVEPVRTPARAGETLRDSMDRIEAWLIRRSLEHHGGRRAATARKLGITREGLYKKMKRYGIE